MKKNHINSVTVEMIEESLKVRSIVKTAELYNIHQTSLHRFMKKHGISHNPVASSNSIKTKRSMKGENNPAWKGGISKNNYVYKKKSISRHPEKHEARKVYDKAKRSGKIKKMPCVICGNPKSEGHHTDYSKPLEVVWLCRKHHVEAHKNTLPLTQINR